MTVNFSITRNGTVLVSVPLALPAASTVECEVPLEESQQYGFEVENREPDTEYSVSLGDIAPEGPAIGQPKARWVYWNDATHFESARGRVLLAVRSKLVNADAGWATRATIAVYVNPTKLNDRRYQAMFEQMRRLAAGIVFDLISKVAQQLDLAPARSVSSRSSQMELQAIAKVWRKTSAALIGIAQQPVTGLRGRDESRLCWGNERLSVSGLSRLVATGVDPRKQRDLPFHASCRVVQESTDVPEHRVIAGVLEFLERRIDECNESIATHMEAIEADRPMRDQRFGNEASLFETNDMPRLARLRQAARATQSLKAEIQSARRLQFLKNIVPSLRFPNSPVFRYLAPYHALRQAVAQYLNESTITLDVGNDVRVKATQRLYEQWVFVQVASALRASGLRCQSESGLLGQRTRYRFTLDIDRGTTLSFEDAIGRVVNIRYEPWIYSEATARQRRDAAVFQGEREDVAWSPDILLEFAFVVPAGLIVEHAIVIDAKYSRTINDRHWLDTTKYLQLRSMHDGRQIARQLWLAHPGETTDPIRFRDSSVRWTSDGPSRPATETLLGIMELIPPDELDVGEAMEGWVEKPSEVVLNWVSGLLGYFGYSPHDRYMVQTTAVPLMS